MNDSLTLPRSSLGLIGDVLLGRVNLINLVNHERFVNPAEKYITYQAKAWAVYRMGRDRVPRYCGKYPNIIQAVRVAQI
jgi:hypothetical protein